MSSSYTSLYQKAKKENTAAVDAYLKELKNSYQKQLAAYSKEIAAKKAAAKTNYTDDYDLNAINHLINQRKLMDRMDALGLNKSGANQALKMGLDVARQNADNMVTMQHAKELNSLDAALNSYKNSLDEKLATQTAAAKKSLTDKNTSLYNSLVTKSMSSSGGSNGSKNSTIISVYNKLLGITSPRQQVFYIDLLRDDGIITSAQAKNLKNKLGLDYYN